MNYHRYISIERNANYILILAKERALPVSMLKEMDEELFSKTKIGEALPLSFTAIYLD